MTRLPALTALTRLVALTLLLALAGTAGAERLTTFLDDLEQVLIAQQAAAVGGDPDVIAGPRVLKKLIKQIGKDTHSYRQEIELLMKIGVKFRGKRGGIADGDLDVTSALNTALQGLTFVVDGRLVRARAQLERLEGAGNRKCEKRRIAALARVSRGERELAAGDAEGLSFKKVMISLTDADRSASVAEKKLRKLRKKLDCPGLVFMHPEAAAVIHAVGEVAGLPVQFDTFKAQPVPGTNDWQFNLFRCKPYAELKLIVRIPPGGAPIGSVIDHVPPGVNPGNLHAVEYREDPKENFRIGFQGDADVSNFDPEAGSITVVFWATNHLETLAAGSLVLTDWYE